MAPSLFSGLSPDLQQEVLTTLEALQLGLDRVGGARPDRRPRWNEVDRIELKQVRPLVQVGQVSVQLQVGPQQKPLWLSLEWLERWGGTFGPRSSVAAARRRAELATEGSAGRYLRRLDEQAGDRERNPEEAVDRGTRPAWMLYLSCPRCARRCTVLCSRRGQHQYACTKCERPASRSNCWNPSGSDRSPWARAERQRLQHEEAAARIRRDYLGYTGRTGGLLQPPTRIIPKPPRMTWDRYDALVRLVEAHETLALMATMANLSGLMSRVMGEDRAPRLDERRQEADMQRWARTVLRLDAWALRQRTWLRKGQPHVPPGRSARAKLARLETSTDGSGHAEESAA
jgi:hypothetical protein